MTPEMADGSGQVPEPDRLNAWPERSKLRTIQPDGTENRHFPRSQFDDPISWASRLCDLRQISVKPVQGT
jgi:hypothetical protein